MIDYLPPGQLYTLGKLMSVVDFRDQQDVAHDITLWEDTSKNAQNREVNGFYHREQWIGQVAKVLVNLGG
ncbi:uncharacterized protein PHALS_03309 [Plasmopara halstedii]|uniref:Uncharacterized protein n=1 Tax=Plasmopara halstedii TaxID=4781 RepID=A0A0P1A986_PLAHL|nr:uncharacterized protein PHALS_03309 [Plasmopara halstedii]CEG36637.1 hypothetical protein PHALS_03309 [Plasmopara halstedii]|eukprot:XP_024573006.1 hypothetical protein PHALS_03309 [Plasmopara halstedii]